MRRILGLALLLLLAAVPLGLASPLTGAWAKYIEVGPDGWTDAKQFRGGERATVLVVGDHLGTTSLHLIVKDAKGTVIAEDKGKDQPAGDMVAIIWYPPRDGEYRIELRNPGGAVNKCYIAIK